MEIAVKCRCGTLLERRVSDEEVGAPLRLFCEGCYLNHEFRWEGRRPVLTLQYFFPDD